MLWGGSVPRTGLCVWSSTQSMPFVDVALSAQANDAINAHSHGLALVRLRVACGVQYPSLSHATPAGHLLSMSCPSVHSPSLQPSAESAKSKAQRKSLLRAQLKLIIWYSAPGTCGVWTTLGCVSRQVSRATLPSVFTAEQTVSGLLALFVRVSTMLGSAPAPPTRPRSGRVHSIPSVLLA